MKQLIILLLSISLFSCGHNAPKSAVVRPVKSIVAEPAEFVEKDFVGMAVPDNAVNLAFKVSGQVLDIPITTGNSVAKGELLAELDPRDFELTLSADLSDFEQASSRLKRAERLLAKEAISRQEYEDAVSFYARAQSTYENSKEVLAQTTLRAPFAAVVERVYVDTYERVQSGQSIVRLVQPQTVSVEFIVPESALSTISQPTTQFTVLFDNHRDHPFKAKLSDYAVTTSDASGFPVVLEIENPDDRLYHIAPGFSCTITIKSDDRFKGAVSLPLTAIYAPAQGGTYVWVVNSDSCVEKRRVTLGELYSTNRVIINSGVNAGDRVVTAGVYQLQEGVKVRII